MSGESTLAGAPGAYPYVGEVTLSAGVRERLVELCRAGLPNEACGIVAGADSTVFGIHPLTNAAASPERYELDPAEQLEAYNAIAETGHEALGVYHSHPVTPARPSSTDIAEAYDPQAVYFIVSFHAEEPSVRAFRIRDGVVAELAVHDEPANTEVAGETKGRQQWQ